MNDEDDDMSKGRDVRASAMRASAMRASAMRASAMPARDNRSALVAVCYLGMLAFGIVLTTLGAILPSLIARFGMSKTDAGALFVVMSFGILVGSLVFGPIVDRRGYKGMLLVGSASSASSSALARSAFRSRCRCCSARSPTPRSSPESRSSC
jgi:fucose permease